MKIGIIGLGYVGLTLALALSSRGVRVHGVEKNSVIRRCLEMGKAHFEETGIHQLVATETASGRFTFSEMFDGECYDACIISVGTPIDENREVVIAGLVEALQAIPKNRHPNFTVILRSTVAAGTTNSLVRSLLEKQKVVNFAFCPERTIEGLALTELFSLPQIISGSSTEALEMASTVFNKLGVEIVRASSVECAELAKLYNNCYRDITFAIGNYFNLYAQCFGVNGIEVLDIAGRNYPRGKIPRPGFVGGPCLSKDSYILGHSGYKKTNIEKIEAFNFFKLGRSFNEMLVDLVADRLVSRFGNRAILVSGVAFKGTPETSDLRDAPSIALVKRLRHSGISVYVHDYVAYREELSREFECEIVDSFNDSRFQVLVIMNNHRLYSTIELGELERFEAVVDLGSAYPMSARTYFKNMLTLGDLFL